MDKNSLVIGEKKKDLINKITGILLDEMSRNNIKEESGQEIASYILSQSKTITDDMSLNNFLKLLAEKYSIFKSTFVNQSLENHMKKTDEEKITGIKEQLSKLINFKSN